MIPPVVASERGRAQTDVVATHRRGCRTGTLYFYREWKGLERPAVEGESPVDEVFRSVAKS